MGYNIHGYGNIHECWMKNSMVHYKDGCGKTHSFPCTLDVDVPPQCNIFASVLVAFFLMGDDVVYIGRFDGVISIYKVCSDSRWLLSGIQHWEAPEPPVLDIAGYKRGETVLYPIYVDRSDNQTLYCTHQNAESRLKTPYSGEFLTSVQVIEALSANIKNDYSVFDERGVVLETDVWSIQESLWRRDCTVFL